MEFTNVHNFYEKRVFEEIIRQNKELESPLDKEQLEDAACLALNKLPPRYIRFDVDTIFYLGRDETIAINEKVHEVVREALSFVSNSPTRE